MAKLLHSLRQGGPARAQAAAIAVCAAALLCYLAPTAAAGPPRARTVFAPGKIVPIPASIPHAPGDMVDRRIVPDLRWIARRFPIYVTDGYSGPLPSGRHVGCRGCHVRNSDHYNGLAVDLVPLRSSNRCDRRWRPITRLARWAEPRQNRPLSPFRWVGYDGDAGHGCGNHLHLSWDHAPTRQFRLARWVDVFPVRAAKGPPPLPAPPPSSAPAPAPSGPGGGIHSGGSGPTGGLRAANTGGIGSGL